MKTLFVEVAMIFGLYAAAYSQVRTIQCIKGETSITYVLVHPLHKVESTSKDVSSAIRCDAAAKSIQSVTASVDVTTFDSGNSNRDSHALEVIDAISYPEASFSSTSITSRNDSLIVSGKLTFHGVTREISMSALPQWSEKKLTVRAAFSISLTDFKVERPSLLMMPVEDTLRFSLVAAYAL
jgi:polyisoprenoid-binding protein YceI